MRSPVQRDIPPARLSGNFAQAACCFSHPHHREVLSHVFCVQNPRLLCAKPLFCGFCAYAAGHGVSSNGGMTAGVRFGI